MVIAANRDAWKQCIALANEAIQANDIAKAKRLLQKAQKLDPSFDVNGEILLFGLLISSYFSLSGK
jgi:Tfp pilus assembly protein PilF